MSGQIVITVVDEPDRFGLEVAVTGDLDTAQAIGFMEMAKLQHLDSKRERNLTVHVEQTPSLHSGDTVDSRNN